MLLFHLLRLRLEHAHVDWIPFSVTLLSAHPILPDTLPWGVGLMAMLSLVAASGTSFPGFEVPA